MKILIAGQTYYQRDNGQAVFTINLAEGLARVGHQVMVLAPSETGQAYRRQMHGVILQTVPALSLLHNTNITAFSGRWVTQAMESFQPKVVHLQDHYFLSRSTFKAARDHGLLTVGTNHFLPENLIDNLPVPTRTHKVLGRLFWSSMLSFYNRLDAVTAPSETAATILRNQKINVPVSAISCGVDLERFRPRPEVDRSVIRRKYKIAPDQSTLLYVGRIDREKDLDILVTALAQLRRGDWQLVLAGKGSFRSELETLVEQLGIRQQVVFTGFIPDDELPLLFNSVDLFTMPSPAELQSIATLEAMASELPILAANARALPELVTPIQNGYLFAAGNSTDAAAKATLLLNQPHAWAAMGTANRQKVRQHRHEQVVLRYTQWYQQMISLQSNAEFQLPLNVRDSLIPAWIKSRHSFRPNYDDSVR